MQGGRILQLLSTKFTPSGDITSSLSHPLQLKEKVCPSTSEGFFFPTPDLWNYFLIASGRTLHTISKLKTNCR